MEQNQVSFFTDIISGVGFPIVIAIILLRNILINFNQKLNELNKTMEELLDVIKEIKRDEKN